MQIPRLQHVQSTQLINCYDFFGIVTLLKNPWHDWEGPPKKFRRSRGMFCMHSIITDFKYVRGEWHLLIFLIDLLFLYFLCETIWFKDWNYIYYKLFRILIEKFRFTGINTLATLKIYIHCDTSLQIISWVLQFWFTRYVQRWIICLTIVRELFAFNKRFFRYTSYSSARNIIAATITNQSLSKIQTTCCKITTVQISKLLYTWKKKKVRSGKVILMRFIYLLIFWRLPRESKSLFGKKVFIHTDDNTGHELTQTFSKKYYGMHNRIYCTFKPF